MTRKLLTLLAALAAAVALAAQPAAADTPNGSNGDNTAVAINTKDGSSLFKFAFDIRRISSDIVDQTNAAVAYASCTDCKTTAIAIQILLVEDSPSTFTPTNAAIAINENCNACQTFAAAYQFVVQSSGPVRFTEEGRRAIHEIRKAIAELEDQNLSPADMDARLKELMGQLQQVLQTELVPVDENAGGDHERGPPERHDKTETATTPATSTPATTAPTTSTTTPTTTTAPTTSTTTPTTTTAPTTSTTTPTTSTGTNGTTTTTP